MKVLIIEDDPATAESVSLAFQLRWTDATFLSTGRGREGIELVEKESPDVVILDLGLPDIDGMQVLREIRQFSNVPIVILSGRTGDSDIIKGLESGAEDYVTKPFNPMVLLSHVKSVLGRTRMPELRGNQARVDGKELSIDLASRRLTVRGKPVALTATEWVLLSELVRNEGRVVSQQRLADRLWGGDMVESESAIRQYISRLRAKLGDNPQAPTIILTEYGTGYRFIRPE